MKSAKIIKLPRLLPRFDDEDSENTGPFGVPCFTMVGSPIAARPPAPVGQAISSYLERYPPQLDDAVVLDMEVDTERKCGEIWRAK